jgi:uncharacterized small protein (DUF1192 family)
VNQSIRLPEVEELARRILVLTDEIRELRLKAVPGRLWYSRAELAALKGMPVSAFYNKSWLLPSGEASKQGGTDRWSFKQVWESGWIWKSDKDLNPRGGEDGVGTRTGTGIQSRVAGAASPLRRVQGFRQGALSRQPG